MTFTPHATTREEYFTHRHHFPYLLALCSPQFVSVSALWKCFSSVSQNVTESQGLRIVVAEDKAKCLYKLRNKNLYGRSKLIAKSTKKKKIVLTSEYEECIKVKAQALHKPSRMT
jgi:hypothetical protein